MATRSIYLVLGSILLYCSCAKSSNSVPYITCPSFDDPLFIEWFPYTTDQKMIFKNSAGLADTISIASVNLSGQTTIIKLNFTADSCIAVATIVSNEKVDSGGILKLFLYDYRTASGLDTVTFYMYGFTFKALAVTDTGLNIAYLSPGIYSASYTNYNFQGRIYNKVQVINSTDTIVKLTNIPWIYKVFIAQNTGIIGYETFPQKEIWALQ